MFYNLRIGKTRYTRKTREECAAIVTAQREKIEAGCRSYYSYIQQEVEEMPSTRIRMGFYGHDGKIFMSINKVKGC